MNLFPVRSADRCGLNRLLRRLGIRSCRAICRIDKWLAYSANRKTSATEIANMNAHRKGILDRGTTVGAACRFKANLMGGCIRFTRFIYINLPWSRWSKDGSKSFRLLHRPPLLFGNKNLSRLVSVRWANHSYIGHRFYQIFCNLIGNLCFSL